MGQRGCFAAVGVALVLSLLGCGDDSATGGAGTRSVTAVGASASTGQLAGVRIPGQTAAVSAKYDEHGLLHLECSSDEDCFAALGYFHAANRFFFMDFVRNLVRGRLGTLVRAGTLVLERDFQNRRFFSTNQGEPLEERIYANASPTVRGYLDAYTRGVNAWIADMRAQANDATLTDEYDFALIVKSAIRDWEPVDCAAVGLYVLNDLSNYSSDEISMGEALPAFDPELAADMFSPRPVFDAFIQRPLKPSPRNSLGESVVPRLNGDVDLGRYQNLLDAAKLATLWVGSGQRPFAGADLGSNNWAVAPTRTANGAALLANDPHLPLTNPSIWFPVEINATVTGQSTYHVAGSTFPGNPAILVGRNESIAWGVTTAYWDLADVYLEELSSDGSTVSFQGKQVPIIEREFQFEDASTQMTIQKKFRWVPHHGPIVSEDLAARKAVSVRWRGHDGGTDLDAFFALGKATSRQEAKAALELASSANQNFVIVDRAGEIAWYPYSRVPSRPWATQTQRPWLPLPGTGEAEWGPAVPFAELPQLENPKSGFIATANGDMTGASADGDLLNDGQAALQAFSKADGTRQRRIADMLALGSNNHDVASMVAMQGDVRSLYGEFVVPVVLADLAGAMLSPPEQSMVDALTEWKFSCPTGLAESDPVSGADSPDPNQTSESIGCTVFHTLFYAIVKEALEDEIAAAAKAKVGRADLMLVARALRRPATIASGDLLWDDVSTVSTIEQRAEIIRRALTLAASHLAVVGLPNAWRWGRLHTLSLRSIFDNFGVATYNAAAVAAPGGLFTVNVASPGRALPKAGEPWRMDYASGASLRFIVEAKSEGLSMKFQLPGGSDLHRSSPFYNNLLAKYLDNDPIDFAFGTGAVAKPAKIVEVLPQQ